MMAGGSSGKKSAFFLVGGRVEGETEWDGFLVFLSKRFGWRAGAGCAATSEVSHVPDLNVAVVQVNLLSARVGAAHDAVCKVESEGTECSGTIYRTDCRPRGVPCALTLRKFIRGQSGCFRRKKGAVKSAQADTSTGTMSLSFSGVVRPVARRHKSTASLRAAATASLRRAAPRAIPATNAFTGG